MKNVAIYRPFSLLRVLGAEHEDCALTEYEMGGHAEIEQYRGGDQETQGQG